MAKFDVIIGKAEIEMSAAEAIRAVRNGTLKRRSLADLDSVIDEIAERNPDFLAYCDRMKRSKRPL